MPCPNPFNNRNRHTILRDDDPTTQYVWTSGRLLKLAAVFAGCQFSWAIQIGYTTPELRSLGMSSTMVGYTWLAGPVSGMIAQPLIGVWSDRCTSPYGRRTPFIVGGTLLVLIALLLFSNAETIGYAFGDTDESHPFGLFVAVVSFWALDFSINIQQAPVRALISDEVPASLHAKANSYVAICNGLGKATGYLLGSVNLLTVVPFFESEIRALYSFGLIFVTTMTTITVLSVTEKPISSDDIPELAREGCIGILSESIFMIKQLPVEIRKVFVVQFFNYLAWFATFIYLTDWFGEVLYDSEPDTEDYDKGVRVGNLALFFMSMSSLVWAFLFPRGIAHFGVIRLWTGLQLVFALCLIILCFVKSTSLAIFIILCTGGHFASVYVLPWSIVTLSAVDAPDKKGIFTAAFNLSQCLPELVVSVIGGGYLQIFNGNLSSIFGLASVAALAGAWAVQYVIVPKAMLNVGDPESHKADNLSVEVDHINNHEPLRDSSGSN